MAARIVAYVRNHHLAMVALFFAFSGSALALQGRNTVDSGDIRPNQVKPVDTDIVKFARAAGEVTTTGSVNDFLGPNLQVKVKPGDVLMLSARAEGQQQSGIGNCFTALHVDLPGTTDTSGARIFTFNSTNYIRRFMVSGPAPGTGEGTTVSTFADAREIPILDGGTATVRLEYQSEGSNVCAYRERMLQAAVLR